MTDVSDTTLDQRQDTDRDAIIRAEWMAGTSLDKIGAMVGCGRSSVSRAAQRLNLPARIALPTRETMPEADLDTLRAEWALGTPVSEIAAKLKCTKGSVLRRVPKLGLDPRPSPIIRDVTPKPRDTDRSRPGYVAPGRVAPSFNRFTQKAPPSRPLPRAAAPAPALAAPSNEPRQVRAGVPTRPCQHVIAEEPEVKVCGFECYTPPKHDKPSQFCNYHHHFRGNMSA